MLLFCNSSNRVNIKLRNDGIQKRRSGFISQSTEYFESFEDIDTFAKTEQEENLIRIALATNEFLAKFLHGKRVQNLIDCMHLKEVKEGEILIRKGDTGSYLYISYTGTYEVSINENVIDMFDDVRVFGELAILYSAKRHATVRCVKSGSLWVLDCPIFKKLIVRTAIEEQEEMVSFLQNVPILGTVPKELLYPIANMLKVEFFPATKKIITQGEAGDTLHIIRVGSVTLFEDQKKIAQLGKGQFFGRPSLMKKDHRHTTVIVDPPGVECLTLPRKYLTLYSSTEDPVNLKLHPIREKCTQYSLDDFEKIAVLGIGGFGKVELVRHHAYRDQVFALKSIRKMEVLGRGHQDQLYSERNVQMACDSQFIVKLYRTYKDSKRVYMLLELCLGGDLWSLLHTQKKHCFEESAAKFYSGCVLEALAYLHDRGIVYRDLKPENIMVHYNGYLKLTDFGFSKKIDSKEKTYTFVGTAEYVAPEIVLNKGHNKGVDYWAFGVLIYELLIGKTPFRTNDPGHLKTYKLILKGIDHAVFPYYVSSKAKSLIKKLCAYTPSDRLGCQRGGAIDIKRHSWFSNLNWYQLNNCLLDAPFRPNLENSMDTRYFEGCDDREESNPPDDFSSWDKDF